MGDKISIRTGNTGSGSSIVGKVSGTGNTVGVGNTSTFSSGNQITVPPEKLDKLPNELSAAMQDFLAKVNDLIAKQPTSPPDAIQEAQAEVEAMVDETQAAVDEAPAPAEQGAAPEVPMLKKMTLGARFAQAAKSVLKLLPKTAETIAAFSPLAPFGKLIGQGVEGIVEAMVKEG